MKWIFKFLCKRIEIENVERQNITAIIFSSKQYITAIYVYIRSFVYITLF
jgi:hypothetical protein